MRTFDTETTTRFAFNRRASPFTEDNWVVAWAFKDRGKEEVTSAYYGSERPKDGWFKEVLEGCKLLVGFNLKFDLLHAIYAQPENLEAWMAYISKGGLIWDCQLAEYLLQGMGREDHMLSLDEVAPRYGGEVKIDEVKILWGQGVSTEDIDRELLMRYLAGGKDEAGTWRPGDVQNTEAVAVAQIARARKAGQLNSLLLNMGALVFTVEAERNGMYVDKARGLEIAADLKQRVDKLSEDLAASLPKLPFEFNWSSIYHKSALLFGGTVRYDSYEYQLKDGTFTYEEGHPDQAYAQKTEDHYLLEDGTTMACAWWEHVRDTEWQGNVPEGKDRTTYKSGKNAGEYKTKKVKADDLDKPKGRQCKRPFTLPRMTEPDPSWAGAIDGVWSTSADVIDALGNRDIPFLKLLKEHVSLSKDLGTYYQTTDPKTGEQSGMLTLVGEDGIVHHSINMVSTVTGRFSSSNPNLQNIPKGNKSDVKTLFTSRFPGGVILQSDFSSLEVYIQAILSGSKQLIADLKAGLDMHCVRLAAAEGMDYDEVKRLTGEDKEWGYKRDKAKIFSFRRAYGGGPASIVDATGLPMEKVKELIAAEEARYPEIETYYEELDILLRSSRKPMGKAIPHPEVPGVLCHLGRAYARTPDGKLYLYQEQPAPKFLVERGQYVSFSPTEQRNYPVQGTGAEWAKAACWMAVREFYRLRNFGGQGLLVNQVHDATYVDAASEVATLAGAVLHACMMAASDYMEHTFKWLLPLPVPTDTTSGASMADEDKAPRITTLGEKHYLAIRKRYFGGKTPSWEK